MSMYSIPKRHEYAALNHFTTPHLVHAEYGFRLMLRHLRNASMITGTWAP